MALSPSRSHFGRSLMRIDKQAHEFLTTKTPDTSGVSLASLSAQA
jgi:hypothetical protein